MPANDSRARSTARRRRPLRDSSNEITDTEVRFASKSVGAVKKKLPEKTKVGRDEAGKIPTVKDEEEEEGDDECTLDRLFLVQSDIASVLRQIDELVVQATKLKMANKGGRKEIESLEVVLSEILSSLKQWVTRFQKAFSNPPMQAKTQLKQTSVSKISSGVNKDEPFEVESPEQTKFESLISPSPLVSWRGDFNVEKGRQLFLLTPLSISKAIPSKHQMLPKPACEKIALSTIGVQQPDFSEPWDRLLGGKMIKTAVSKPSGFLAATSDSRPENEVVTSPSCKKKAVSELFMTPRLKTSPPKSCALLEPASQSCLQEEVRLRKSTPFPIGIHNWSASGTSESSGSGSSGNLAFKYPELLGLQQASGIVRKDLESSPDWMFSPLKTCVLLEPTDEKSEDKVGAECDLPVSHASNENKEESSSETNEVKEHVGGSSKLVESTPLWKEPESIMRTGRRAGESTLKRELWTRFEAATTHGLRSNVAGQQGTSKKGFLEMLDEVSSNEESSTPDASR